MTCLCKIVYIALIKITENPLQNALENQINKPGNKYYSITVNSS